MLNTRLLAGFPRANFAHDDSALQFCVVIPSHQLWEGLERMPSKMAHKLFEMHDALDKCAVGGGFRNDFVNVDALDFEESHASPYVDERHSVAAVQVPAHQRFHHVVENFCQCATDLLCFAVGRAFRVERAHVEALSPHVAHQLAQRDDGALQRGFRV